jgi:hypothetical protein
MEVYEYKKHLLSKEHPIEANTQRVHISFIAIFSILQDFRSHVKGRSKHGDSELLLPENFGESKIGDFDNSII